MMQQYRFINNSNQLNMFRAMIPPIFRSIRLCLQLVVLYSHDVASRQPGRLPAGNIVGA